jgi:hypothetical protein
LRFAFGVFINVEAAGGGLAAEGVEKLQMPNSAK